MSADDNLYSFIFAVRELYKLVNGRDTGFDIDFQQLKRLSSSLKQNKENDTPAGQRPENKKKNRYRDILPFDFSRVKLKNFDGGPNSDYINASFIKGAEGCKNYIASQGPLPHTVLDFWQMLWQYNISVIVMVCREYEMGKKKCERYWSDKEETKDFGDIKVTLHDIEELKDGYCVRTIKAQRGSESRYIKQFHYISWPDHGVPKTCFEILTLINHVRNVQDYDRDISTPLCVHCSAGCGRTGAILTVDYVRQLLAQDKVPKGLRTYDIIAEMRQQRPAIVQTRDQYEFVNATIVEMFEIYLQTRSVSYKDFSEGYHQSDYVNISLSTPSRNETTGSKTSVLETTPQNQPTKLNYENVDIIRGKQTLSKELSPWLAVEKGNSIDGYPAGAPPAKPSLTASGNVRPVSMLFHGSAHTNTDSDSKLIARRDPPSARKQSAPVVGFRVAKSKAENTKSQLKTVAPDQAEEVSKPPLLSPKPRVDSATKTTLDTKLSGKEQTSLEEHDQISTVLSSVARSNLSSSLTSPRTPLSPKDGTSIRSISPQVQNPKKTLICPVRNNFEVPDSFVKERIKKLTPTEDKPVSKILPTKVSAEEITSGVTQKPPVTLPKPKGTWLLSPKTVPVQRLNSTTGLHAVSNKSAASHRDPVVLANKKVQKCVSDISIREESGPPMLSQTNPSVMRSSSVGAIDNSDEADLSGTVWTDCQDQEKKDNASEISGKVVVNPTPVISFYNRGQSDGKAYFTSKGLLRANSLKSLPHKTAVRYSIATPTPYKPVHSKLSLPKKVQASESSELDHKEHYTSTCSFFYSPVSENYKIAAHRDCANPASTEEPGSPIGEVRRLDTKQTPSTSTLANTPLPKPRALPRKRSPPSDSIDKRTYQNIGPFVNNGSNADQSPSHGFVRSASNTTWPHDDVKKKPPPKPRRTFKPSQSTIPSLKAKTTVDSVQDTYSLANDSAPLKFQKYDKNHLYNDVVTSSSSNPATESHYEDFDEDNPRKSNSMPGIVKPSPEGRSSTPPKLPARTLESQIALSELPPTLPTRTPESYLLFEAEAGGDQVNYEAVECEPNMQGNKSHSEERRTSSAPAVGTKALAMAKGVFEKTISKVGASISKSEDDTTNTKLSTIDKRTPTYFPGSTIYSGRDMGFGQRPLKKVKGGRSVPFK